EQGKLGQYYRKTMLYPQKDNQIPFPSGTSGKIDVFFNSLLGVAGKRRRLPPGDHRRSDVSAQESTPVFPT
ncbi:hypothetical protein, partial [Thiolapillus sp.]